jgi:hypothetical protein
MKRYAWSIPAVMLAASCGTTADQGDDVVVEAALNGQLSPVGPLTRLSYSDTSESSRETDTQTYYNSVLTDPDGGGLSISRALPTLSAFRSRYGFGGTAERVTYYYNRGDLGIGREMHCVDGVTTNSGLGEIACYVTNFAAGDDNTEFTFGLSNNIAFSNLDAGHAFATVAMVFRSQMATTARNRVFFAVYNATGGALLNAAALDRFGITFANAFNQSRPNNPDPSFGVPGVDFNNHIPSNCIACHGGSYDHTSHSTTGALFLPFDLDQFDYEPVAGRTRLDQCDQFKHENELVRKVAVLTGTGGGSSVVSQLDAWYHNTAFQTPRTEVFEAACNPLSTPPVDAFDSNAVVAGWTGQSIFQSVVRKSCRTCHIANEVGRTFETAASFDSLAPVTAADLCNYAMPHSLQSLREFWFSGAPTALVNYFTNIGQTSAANQLAGCGPGSVATLDPHKIGTMDPLLE